MVAHSVGAGLGRAAVERAGQVLMVSELGRVRAPVRLGRAGPARVGPELDCAGLARVGPELDCEGLTRVGPERARVVA